jgi:hypothetical protein
LRRMLLYLTCKCIVQDAAGHAVYIYVCIVEDTAVPVKCTCIVHNAVESLM